MPAKVVKDERNYYVDDVRALLGISEAYAYKLIRDLNAELEAAGYLTIKGRIPKEYFHKRWYGSPENVTARTRARQAMKGGEKCAV